MKNAIERIRTIRFPFRASIAAVIAIGITAAIVTFAAPGQYQNKYPNIIYVITDDQTFESLNKMKFLTQQPDWIKFSRAYANTPICCPARATLLSGQYSHHTGVETNKEGWKFNDRSTVATWLKVVGYRTGFVGKYLNEYPWSEPGTFVPQSAVRPANYRPPGWNTWVAFSGPPGYLNYTLNINGTLVNKGGEEADYSTDVLTDQAARFIYDNSRGPAREQHLFLVYAPYAPHTPSTPAERHSGLFKGLSIPHAPNYNETDISDKPKWLQENHAQPLPTPKLQAYDENRRKMYRSLQAVDEGLQRIYQALKDTGRFENTAIIFTSDNGYNWGEHRLNEKRCVYDECLHVPLLIHLPNQSGRAEGKIVGQVDLAPTIAALAGTTAPNADGKNLLPLIQNPGLSWVNEVLLHGNTAQKNIDAKYRPPFWGLRTGQYKYIELPATGERELYDLLKDPYELNNLAGDPYYAAVLKDLAAKLYVRRGPIKPNTSIQSSTETDAE
ncbi:MAG TPA: sulfatase [Patescibacteria group bacterium]|jgi:arylsulfatase A-like enzyme